MPTMSPLVGIAIVVVALMLAALGYVLASRRSPAGGREHHTPTNVYAVTAGAMSLLIAFTLSMTFAQYTDAQSAAQQEAAAVVAMSRAATFMEPSLRDELRNELICYSKSVIAKEWPSMRNGSAAPAPEVVESLAVMDGILTTNIKGAGVGLDLWESANDTRADARLERLHVAGDSVPSLLWFLLVAGSLIAICSLFVYADSSKPAWGHALVIIGPVFIATAALVVIYFFDHPYSDSAGGVQTDEIELAITHMQGEQIGDLPRPECVRNNGNP